MVIRASLSILIILKTYLSKSIQMKGVKMTEESFCHHGVELGKINNFLRKTIFRLIVFADYGDLQPTRFYIENTRRNLMFPKDGISLGKINDILRRFGFLLVVGVDFSGQMPVRLWFTRESNFHNGVEKGV